MEFLNGAWRSCQKNFTAANFKALAVDPHSSFRDIRNIQVMG
jgi:hypothetical protein